MNNEDIAAGVLGVLLFVVFATVILIYYGFVFHCLWGWFIVPFGLPQINIPYAIGLSCLPGMVRPPGGKADLGVTLTGPAIALLVGYICKSFI